jgi:Family of unknown function (DUF5681)
MAKPPCRDGRRNNRPPVSGQFPPGKSPNPSGRPPGSRNRRKVLEDELNKSVFVTENGKRVRKKKWEIIIAQQVNKAMSSDLKAAQYITDQMFKYGLLNQESDEAPAKLNLDEEAIFDEVAQRIRASEPLAPPKVPPDENAPSRPLTDEDEQS